MKYARVVMTVRSDYGKRVRKRYEAHQIKGSWMEMKRLTIRKEEISNSLTTVQKDNYVLVGL